MKLKYRMVFMNIEAFQTSILNCKSESIEIYYIWREYVDIEFLKLYKLCKILQKNCILNSFLIKDSDLEQKMSLYFYIWMMLLKNVMIISGYSIKMVFISIQVQKMQNKYRIDKSKALTYRYFFYQLYLNRIITNK